MNLIKLLIVFAVVLANASNVLAENEVATAKERAAATTEGPTENKGVKSVVVRGSTPIDSLFAGVNKRVLRFREIIVEADGVIATHSHITRPGTAYILEGEIVEYRSDAEDPIIRRKGDVIMENLGLTHWWINESWEEVRVLVVDVPDLQELE